MKLLSLLLTAWIPLFCLGQKAAVSQKQASNQAYVIDVYPAHKNKNVYPLSTIANRIEYIPLEKTEKCILESSMQNFIITSRDIFVFDYKLCYRFDRQGRFLNRVGRIGKGPEELVRPVDIALDTINRWVYMLDGKKLVKYSYEGKFVHSYELKSNSYQMLLYGKDLLILDDGNYQYAKPGKRYSMKFYSTQKEKVIAQVTCDKKDKIPFSISFPSMYSYNGKLFVKDYWDDIIYQVQNPENMKAYARIELGKFKHRDKDDNSPFTGESSSKDKMVFDVTFSTETSRYIFLVGSKGLFFYDKYLDNTFCSDFVNGEEDWFSFSNDLNGGPNMKSNNFPKLRYNDNTLITYHNAYEFFEFEGDESAELKTLKSKLSPDDNPVLALIHLKIGFEQP